MNAPCWLALLAVPLGVLLAPAASADHVCIGRNPADGQCIVGAHAFPTSIYSYCASLLLNPPVPGAYYYAAGCSPNVCAYDEIICPGERAARPGFVSFALLP